MADQLDFFTAPEPSLAAGFVYRAEVIGFEEERALLAQIEALPFKEFEFHGYVGKRRTVSFGAEYDFQHEPLRSADPMPGFLLALRDTAARFAGVEAAALQHVLVTEYAEHAGIGWHRDKGVFGDVIGISLLAPCRFRLRRKRSEGWQRVAIVAQPRSAYLLRGPARTEWEHSIPAVESRRYSVTFRTMR